MKIILIVFIGAASVFARPLNAQQILVATSLYGNAQNHITDFWYDGVTCGSGIGFVATKHNSGKPQAQQQESVPTGCQLLLNEASAYGDNSLWQMEYDTAKKMIEQCANGSFALGRSMDGFSLMSQAVQELGNRDPLRSTYYNWLKSVLYLNTTDPEYFCQCVYAMSGEVPIPNHIYPDTGYNWTLALQNWLIQNTNCDSAYLRNLYKGTRNAQHQEWSSASGAYALVTTLPPLNVIDPELDTLLARHSLLAVGTPQGILSNASAYPNPTGSGTVISFGISKEAYVKIELYDLLGHPVGSAGFESLFEPGNKAVPISLAGLQPGTYIACITTAYAEVQSMKIVKE